MIEALEGYFVFVALGVVVVGVATWFAVRQPPPRRVAAGAAGPSYGLWFLVLAVVVLAARGSLSAAGVLLLGVIAYTAVLRLRAARSGARSRR